MFTSRRFLAGCGAVSFLSYLNLHSTFTATPPTVLAMEVQLDNMTSLDPHESFKAVGSEIVGNLYQRLVMPNPLKPSEVKGELATHCKVSNEGKTLTFHINPKEKFFDGTLVTAEDAAFSL
ncbi:MAG: ABC transporter substrate-binding protein [Candidatus Malihini olakiniferum]